MAYTFFINFVIGHYFQYSDNPEFLWRLAMATRNMAILEEQKKDQENREKKKKLIFEGMNIKQDSWKWGWCQYYLFFYSDSTQLYAEMSVCNMYSYSICIGWHPNFIHDLLTPTGYKYAEKAYHLDKNNPQCNKWFGILCGMRGEYLGRAERIKSGFQFKEHLDKALELMPEDASVHYLLGRFCFEVQYVLQPWSSVVNLGWPWS